MYPRRQRNDIPKNQYGSPEESITLCYSFFSYEADLPLSAAVRGRRGPLKSAPFLCRKTPQLPNNHTFSCERICRRLRRHSSFAAGVTGALLLFPAARDSPSPRGRNTPPETGFLFESRIPLFAGGEILWRLSIDRKQKFLYKRLQQSAGALRLKPGGPQMRKVIGNCMMICSMRSKMRMCFAVPV